MKNPLITVGIPSFNNAKFIATALESVVKQTYTNIEIIVVDNFSTDNTDQILAGFDDSRISIIKAHNGGSISISRNLIMANARGEWIAFLDSDDWWTFNKLRVCSMHFQEGIDLIYHNLQIISDNNREAQNKLIKSRKLRKPIFQDLLINGNTIATSSVVVRSSILKKVNGMNESNEMVGIEDFNTWIKISQVSDGFKLVSKNLGFYRVHGQNYSKERYLLEPTAAYVEFLPLLTSNQIRIMQGNYEFAKVRMKFLTNKGNLMQKELLSVIWKGRLLNRIKALYMFLIMSNYKVINKWKFSISSR